MGIVLNHYIYGNLLWQQEKTDTRLKCNKMMGVGKVAFYFQNAKYMKLKISGF